MILEVKDLKYQFDDKKIIFNNVNFSIEKGEILTILGPNGAGKSTLLNCLANLYKPSNGEIILKDKPLKCYKLNEIAKILGYVPQTHTPAYAYTVREFVVMGRAPYIGMFQKPSKKDYELVDTILSDMNIMHVANCPYTQISGGERQQATIARAIVQKPEIIMFDEPTNHLDYGNQIRMIKLIKKLASKGYSIILTTHMPDHAIMLGGKVGVLDYDGKLIVGKSDEILKEDILRKIYKSDLKVVFIEEVGRKVCVSGKI